MKKAASMALFGVLMTGAGVMAQQPSAPPSLPPAPAALSVPNPLAGLAPGTRDLYQAPDGSDRFQHNRPHPRPPVVVVPGIYVPGPYYYPDSYYDYDRPDPHEDAHRRMHRTFRRALTHEPRARGGLTLETLPDAAQVYVDGFYAGLVEEFGSHGRPMTILAGAHHLELRAPGYETLAFSVMIEPNEILRYRGEMQRVSTPARPVIVMPAQQTTVKSLYIIPNCYAGDRPPAGALPKGCDRKNLQTRK